MPIFDYYSLRANRSSYLAYHYKLLSHRKFRLAEDYCSLYKFSLGVPKLLDPLSLTIESSRLRIGHNTYVYIEEE